MTYNKFIPAETCTKSPTQYDADTAITQDLLSGVRKAVGSGSWRRSRQYMATVKAKKIYAVTSSKHLGISYLAVIGILLALQIDIWNEDRKSCFKYNYTIPQ